MIPDLTSDPLLLAVIAVICWAALVWQVRRG
jgi:hypothetical protein